MTIHEGLKHSNTLNQNKTLTFGWKNTKPKTFDERKRNFPNTQKLTSDLYKNNPVIDINISEPDPIFLFTKKIDALECEIETLRYLIQSAWKAKYLPSTSINLENLKQKLLKIGENSNEDKEKRLDAFQTIEFVNKMIKLMQKSIKLNKKFSKLKNESKESSSIFVTFKTRKHRDIFMKLLPSSKYEIFRTLFCCSKKRFLFMNGYKITAINPADPINLAWSSLNKKSSSKFFRRAFSYTISLILLLLRKKFKIIFFSSLYLNRIQSLEKYSQ